MNKKSNAGRKKLPVDKKVVSTPIYLRPSEKSLIINEHGSLREWKEYEIKRLQKKLSKKVA